MTNSAQLQREIHDLSFDFDRKYYLERYKDVAAAGIDPIWHYCVSGWQEGRNPSVDFDTLYYLRSNADIADAGINPFWHFVIAGRKEGRNPKPFMAALRHQLGVAWSNAAYRGPADIRLGAPTFINESKLLLSLRGRSRKLVVAFSHDDYIISTGGVQNIIGDECEEFRRQGMDYLHLCPARPKLTLADKGPVDEFLFAARLNGEALGRINGAALGKLVVGLRDAKLPVRWIIHHLMGHSPELIGHLIMNWRGDTPLFWSHDYFAGCSGYTLLRNAIEYCGSPEPTSSACRVCVHGGERAAHRERIAELVRMISPLIISPSQLALEIWRKATNLSELPAQIVSPATLVFGGPKSISPQSSICRIAYIGNPVFHKGWATFENLALTLKDDERYRFFQIGSSGSVPHSITHVEARVTPQDRAAMVAAIVANEIDIVVSWSLWPETFCFTAHEAIAAGTFLVYRRNQGHVDVAASQYAAKASHAVENETDLLSYFRSGRALVDASHASPSIAAMIPSVGSAEVQSDAIDMECVL